MDLLDVFGCADVDSLRFFFNMEVWAFWIIIKGLELRRGLIVLIYACLILFFIGYQF